MKLGFSLVALVVGLSLSGTSYAQTGGWAQTELNRLTASSNANAYTSDRIRAGIINNSVARPLGAASSTLLAGAMGRPMKPFSSISRGPSVTPYLQLDRPFSNTATDYYTLVRPQLEQQRINQQMQRDTQQMQRQLSEVTSRPPINVEGSEYMAPTGHAAVFMNMNGYMNYGGYYPMPRARRR